MGFILASAVGFLVYATEGLSTFGANPKEKRLERVRQASNYDGKSFQNPVKTRSGLKEGSFWDTARRWMSGREGRRPRGKVPVSTPELGRPNQEARAGLRATWLGHSTVLLEIDGHWILTDPIWSKRCSPLSLAGPVRFHGPVLDLEKLPPLDAVIISHDHFDHLDKTAITALARTGVRFHLPLGVGAHLERWGLDREQIIEVNWWGETLTPDGQVRLTATPARHFSGRVPWRTNPTLWSSWTIIGPRHRVFFSGDSGFFPGFEEIGRRFGPFDLTLIEIGAYDRNWPDIHMNPELAVEAHQDLKGKVLLPIHWGTFNLAFHAWDEPIERLTKAARAGSIRMAAPRPGQTIRPDRPPEIDPWWLLGNGQKEKKGIQVVTETG
jgi:L-ascorbate metabolism protein UlaG (beta-lactamase superfamily)